MTSPFPIAAFFGIGLTCVNSAEKHEWNHELPMELKTDVWRIYGSALQIGHLNWDSLVAKDADIMLLFVERHWVWPRRRCRRRRGCGGRWWGGAVTGRSVSEHDLCMFCLCSLLVLNRSSGLTRICSLRGKTLNWTATRLPLCFYSGGNRWDMTDMRT